MHTCMHTYSHSHVCVHAQAFTHVCPTFPYEHACIFHAFHHLRHLSGGRLLHSCGDTNGAISEATDQQQMQCAHQKFKHHSTSPMHSLTPHPSPPALPPPIILLTHLPPSTLVYLGLPVLHELHSQHQASASHVPYDVMLSFQSVQAL